MILKIRSFFHPSANLLINLTRTFTRGLTVVNTSMIFSTFSHSQINFSKRGKKTGNPYQCKIEIMTSPKKQTNSFSCSLMIQQTVRYVIRYTVLIIIFSLDISSFSPIYIFPVSLSVRSFCGIYMCFYGSSFDV